MSGYLTPGQPLLSKFSGSELFFVDTQNGQGISPESGAVSLQMMATQLAYFSNFASTTTVAGTRYYSSLYVGSGQALTGINVMVGSTGGTDKWLVELHDSNGNVVATSALAGATVGTAGSWQPFALTASTIIPAGQYFVVVQSNGTTAKIGTYNAPTSPELTGSATGTFGTVASITPPTTYTAGVGPIVTTY